MTKTPDYRLFDGSAEVGHWQSLWSCQQQANGLAGRQIEWSEPQPSGPTGHGRHWFSHGDRNRFTIAEWVPEKQGGSR